VRVYGAASLGALRAAELSAFGMFGIGKVFEAYQTGALEADDEVAVAHASPERGYTQLSEALVNIRATLERALQEKIVDEAVAERLLGAAKSIFYPQRTYSTLLDRAVEEGLSEASASSFRSWLGPREARKVDQKRADARLLVEELRAPRMAPGPIGFHFEYTEVWHELLRQLGQETRSRARFLKSKEIA
jgi:hypothetical protein